MNKQELIRNACLAAKAKGIKLHRGAWFNMVGGSPYACCAIGALLLSDENFKFAEDPTNPGYVKKACQILECDPHWLQRFWMGFDRGHQVMLVNDKDKETKDEVAMFGLQLAKELADSK